MSGELLIRVINYEKFVALTTQGRSPIEAARTTFLDEDRWSLVDRIGTGWVIIDGAAFVVSHALACPQHAGRQGRRGACQRQHRNGPPGLDRRVAKLELQGAGDWTADLPPFMRYHDGVTRFGMLALLCAVGCGRPPEPPSATSPIEMPPADATAPPVVVSSRASEPPPPLPDDDDAGRPAIVGTGTYGATVTDNRPAAPAKQELTVLAELVEMPKNQFACGYFHFVVVMRYEVMRVVSGTYAPRALYVAHGCPEMPRSMYKSGSGSLQRFKVGDVHRLVLGPVKEARSSVTDDFGDPRLPRFWSREVDLAARP